MGNAILEDLARIRGELAKLKTLKITVGVQADAGTNIHGKSVVADDTLIMIAGVHEYGITIKMTDKMRRYLGAMGLFSDDGKSESKGGQKGYVNIPERSFIRKAYDTGKSVIDKTAKEAFADMMQGNIDAKGVAEAIGKAAVEATVGIMGADAKPIIEFSAEQRKQSTSGAPLHDTGNLLNHITYKIEGG